MSSFDWTPQHAVRDSLPFVHITVDEVLFEYDGPRIFTSKAEDTDYLFYLSCEAGPFVRYLVVAANKELIAELKVGARSVLDALNQSVVWVVDGTWDGGIFDVWRTALDRVPAKYLPKRGVMLRPDLQPVFTLRYTGSAFEPGFIRASTLEGAVKRAIDAVQKLGARNPIVQRFQLGSLELDFSADIPPESKGGLPVGSEQILPQAGRIERALDALDINDDLQGVPTKYLQALSHLTSVVDRGNNRVEIGGSIFRGGKLFEIDVQRANRIREALSRREPSSAENVLEDLSPPRPESLRGFIRRFHKDAGVFYLKPLAIKRLRKCTVPPHLVEMALELFVSDTECVVYGMRQGRDMFVDRIQVAQNLDVLR